MPLLPQHNNPFLQSDSNQSQGTGNNNNPVQPKTSEFDKIMTSEVFTSEQKARQLYDYLEQQTHTSPSFLNQFYTKLVNHKVVSANTFGIYYQVLEKLKEKLIDSVESLKNNRIAIVGCFSKSLILSTLTQSDCREILALSELIALVKCGLDENQFDARSVSLLLNALASHQISNKNLSAELIELAVKLYEAIDKGKIDCDVKFISSFINSLGDLKPVLGKEYFMQVKKMLFNQILAGLNHQEVTFGAENVVLIFNILPKVFRPICDEDKVIFTQLVHYASRPDIYPSYTQSGYFYPDASLMQILKGISAVPIRDWYKDEKTWAFATKITNEIKSLVSPKYGSYIRGTATRVSHSNLTQFIVTFDNLTLEVENLLAQGENKDYKKIYYLFIKVLNKCVELLNVRLPTLLERHASRLHVVFSDEKRYPKKEYGTLVANLQKRIQQATTSSKLMPTQKSYSSALFLQQNKNEMPDQCDEKVSAVKNQNICCND